MRTVLIGCDQAYYDTWAITLLRSIQYHAPWVSLHCHIVNPENLTKIPNVTYTTEHRIFSNDDAMTAYLQAVRFKVAYEEYSNQPVMIVDADSKVLGRLASEIAKVINGKHKPDFSPHVDNGDNVIVLNADKVKLTGKKWTDKVYVSHTGYPGGQQ